MKNHLSVFSLSMLLAHASSGTMNHSEFDTINADSRDSNSGSTRVWVEKSARRVNVDSNGVILKGYDVVSYFTQDRQLKAVLTTRPHMKERYTISVPPRI